ncbi:hypothetical protein GCM10011495_40420 [Hymenobacter frigidus]|uniref:Class I lanthipeptide n=1 Tax=Hymenobacter frigidus TaxID=1524095 RepID=A0ABQ2AHW9_9BACT|nr:class I lanthipeptide [Hymenobacter frigidus]GGH91712.1 hypothetical protein GCM10011495_40420 [Hymenobacter frigidus]
MKKQAIKLDKALSLDKETIAKLNEDQLGTLEGGMVAGTTITCNAVAEAQAFPNSCGACSCNG